MFAQVKVQVVPLNFSGNFKVKTNKIMVILG